MRGSKVLATAVIAAGLSILGGGAAIAGDPSTAVDSAKPDRNDTSKRVCRIVTPTGSRFTTRVCKTAGEWEKGAESAQNRLDEEARGNRDLSPPR